MGYEMPNVVKEIYLPVPPNNQNNPLNLEEYKRIYGIDLNEILDFTNITDGQISLRSSYAYSKVYLVATPEYVDNAQTGILGQRVTPITEFRFNEDNIVCVFSGSENANFSMSIQLCFKFDDVNNVVLIYGGVI